jgi:hypothetical protein
MVPKPKQKHMKTGDLDIKIHFHGKRPELRIMFTTKVAKQLYRRLRNRFGK